MEQLHKRTCFTPINIADLTPEEKKQVMDSLIFLVEKKGGTVKGQTCANGSIQRAWTDKDDTTSPTVASESIMLIATIEAKENRDVATIDIPNAFIQTPVKRKKGKKRMRQVGNVEIPQQAFMAVLKLND